MFELEGLRDPLFLALYVVAGCLALVASFYLLFRRRNAVAPDIRSSLVLRRWTAAFLLAAALSHVWWLVLGTVWMTDDHLVRTITVILLDHSTLVLTLVIIGFLVWRVETLQELESEEDMDKGVPLTGQKSHKLKDFSQSD